MADVRITQRQTEGRRQGGEQGHATQCERGMSQRAPVSLLWLALRALLTATPFDLMRRLTQRVDRFFEDMSISPMTVWSPSIAISEKDGQILVCVKLPGMSKDNVRVELTQARLIISGERNRKRDDRREEIYGSERFCGSFSRTIPIPDDVQMERWKRRLRMKSLQCRCQSSKGENHNGYRSEYGMIWKGWRR
jgi:HSP20 family protein